MAQAWQRWGSQPHAASPANDADAINNDIASTASVSTPRIANIVTAKGIKDSIGVYSQHPVFKEGEETTTQDSLSFNFKTEKAKIWGLKTEQEGIIIKGAVTKKENDSTIYVRDIIFTTSEKDKPDYYIKTKNVSNLIAPMKE